MALPHLEGAYWLLYLAKRNPKRKDVYILRSMGKLADVRELLKD